MPTSVMLTTVCRFITVASEVDSCLASRWAGDGSSGDDLRPLPRWWCSCQRCDVLDVGRIELIDHPQVAAMLAAIVVDVSGLTTFVEQARRQFVACGTASARHRPDVDHRQVMRRSASRKPVTHERAGKMSVLREVWAHPVASFWMAVSGWAQTGA